MRINGTSLVLYIRTLALLLLAAHTAAQQDAATHQPTVADITKMKQNPVSGLKSVFLQNVNVPVGNGIANSFSIQPVWPFPIGSWKLITYTIIPIQWVPETTPGAGSDMGLGNILFNGFFRPNKKSALTWGIGPSAQIPTRTDSSLGSDRLCLGPAVLLYGAGGPWAGGVVLQNFWSLGGAGVNKVNEMSTQYVLYYNFNPSTYLESNSTIIADWTKERSERWTVPLGGGPGKTFQIGKSKLFYSASAQGFYNVVHPGVVGKWTAIGQFQIIFSQ
jgi:hypothetical protein